MRKQLLPESPVPVLLVEDNQADARLVREAVRGCAVEATLHAVQDGEQALAFLRREAPFEGAARPRLILLDLNLPRKGGRELLAELKADRDFKRIPVVVLTTSKADEDILTSYDNHANCYLAKPIELDSFLKTISQALEFWLGLVRLPPA